MAFIRKEGKYYQVYFQIGNKKYKRSTRTTSRKIADDVRKKIENELATGLFKLDHYSPRRQKLLADFFVEAIEYSKTNKAIKTAEREARIFRNFLHYCGNFPISNVTVKLIESYKTYLLNDRGFKPNGINIELRHLSAAFTLAVKYGYLTTNAFKQVKKVKTPKKKPKFLTAAQAETLLIHTQGTNIYQYIFIALNTGGRISEVCGLNWKDVDLENGIVQFHGKGAKERTVPIPRGLNSFLGNLRRRKGNVVTGSTNPADVTRYFRKYADQVALHEFTFHNLRDTYASWLVQHGVNLKIIQELLGHESIQTTLIYAHLAPDSRFQAVKVIDQILDGSKTVTPTKAERERLNFKQ